MGLRRYRELLRIPGVTPLLLAAFVARLPYGLFALALILMLRAHDFGYGSIGIVAAASGLSVGMAAPVFGRLIDRVGQTRVLAVTSVLGAVTGVGLVVATLAEAGTALLTVIALACGLTVPPVSPSLRTLLPGLVGRERLALWGVGSLAGGLWYGAQQWRGGTARRFLGISALLAIGLTPLPLAGSMPVFAALVVLAGLGLAPSTAVCYSLVGELAPEGAVTEAYAWQIVAYVSGSALGAWLGGVVVEEVGVTTALAAAPASAFLGLLVAFAGRRSLTA